MESRDGGRVRNSGRGEQGKRRSERGPQEAGGTFLGGRRRNNRDLPVVSPPAGRGEQPARRPGRCGQVRRRAPPGQLQPLAAERTATPLTLSDHGFEADGGHRAARVSGLRASSPDARGLRRLPGLARSAGCSPPPQSRAGDRLTRGLRAGARREPERGCRPTSARAGAGPPWGGAPRQSFASAACLRQSHCGPGARPRPPRCGWARGGSWLVPEPRSPSHLTRRAPPSTARSLSAGS